MTSWFLSLALAAPPVPTWTVAAREPSEALSDLEVAPAAGQGSPSIGAVRRDGPSGFETTPAQGHGWADPATLAFDVSGRAGCFYYVMATARGGGMVAHWRQGPIAGEDLTRTFQLQVPSDLPSLLAEIGTAHLSLTMVTVDRQDREIGRSRLGTTWIRAEGSAVIGGQVGPTIELAPEGSDR